MIDESIREGLLAKHGEVNFKAIIAFMDSTGIEFRDRKLTWPLGVATFYCLYLDLEHLNKYDDKIIAFVILHEIAHYKRIARVGKDKTIEILSTEDFDEFCKYVINEEIIADRYSCLLYQKFNGFSFPRKATQQLEIPERQIKYREIAKQLFGVIKNSEETYIKLLESFLDDRK